MTTRTATLSILITWFVAGVLAASYGADTNPLVAIVGALAVAVVCTALVVFLTDATTDIPGVNVPRPEDQRAERAQHTATGDACPWCGLYLKQRTTTKRGK